MVIPLVFNINSSVLGRQRGLDGVVMAFRPVFNECVIWDEGER